MEAAWMVVGKAQRDVPAHVAQEYCRPDRSFYSCPSFNEFTLPRVLTFYNGITSHDESWFPLTSSNSGLGFNFGAAGRVPGAAPAVRERGRLALGAVTRRGAGAGGRVATRDLAAITRLDEVRTADLTLSREHLNPPAVSPMV